MLLHRSTCITNNVTKIWYQINLCETMCEIVNCDWIETELNWNWIEIVNWIVWTEIVNCVNNVLTCETKCNKNYIANLQTPQITTLRMSIVHPNGILFLRGKRVLKYPLRQIEGSLSQQNAHRRAQDSLLAGKGLEWASTGHVCKPVVPWDIIWTDSNSVT